MTQSLSYCIIITAVKIYHFTAVIFILTGGYVVAKNLEVSVLVDFYGDMLTDKQRNFLDLYYNEDLSLSEIAENEGITCQGVRDSIKRAEVQLFDMESKLHLSQRFGVVRDGLKEISECADKIYNYNLEHSLSREINDNVARIKSLAE